MGGRPSAAGGYDERASGVGNRSCASDRAARARRRRESCASALARLDAPRPIARARPRSRGAKAALLAGVLRSARDDAPAPARRRAAEVPAERRRELLWACATRRRPAPAPSATSPLAEFGAEPLRRNLNDLGWLERVARAHEAVLERAAERARSFRSGSAPSSRRRGRPADARRAHARRSSGARRPRRPRGVGGQAAARPRAPASAAADGRGRGARHGTAYLMQRREERRRARRRATAPRARRGRPRAAAGPGGRCASCDPPQNRELSGHEGEMVLNGAYLVERDRADDLDALVGELQSALRCRSADRAERPAPAVQLRPEADREHERPRANATSRSSTSSTACWAAVS